MAGGRELTRRHWAGGPRGALRAGVAMIPEGRQEHGLLSRRPVGENISLTTLDRLSRAGLVRRRAERRAVGGMLGELGIRTRSQATLASALSGGNQQKLLFARVLLRQPQVLIADEPTRGVDVGSKRAIYELLTSLAAPGRGVLLISSDVEEILRLAHRVLVMRQGRVTAELTGDGVTEAAILGAAFGAATEVPEAGGLPGPGHPGRSRCRARGGPGQRRDHDDLPDQLADRHAGHVVRGQRPGQPWPPAGT